MEFRVEWYESKEEQRWGYLARDTLRDHNEYIGWAAGGLPALESLLTVLTGRKAERIILAADVPFRESIPDRWNDVEIVKETP